MPHSAATTKATSREPSAAQHRGRGRAAGRGASVCRDSLASGGGTGVFSTTSGNDVGGGTISGAAGVAGGETDARPSGAASASMRRSRSRSVSPAAFPDRILFVALCPVPALFMSLPPCSCPPLLRPCFLFCAAMTSSLRMSPADLGRRLLSSTRGKTTSTDPKRPWACPSVPCFCFSTSARLRRTTSTCSHPSSRTSETACSSYLPSSTSFETTSRSHLTT